MERELVMTGIGGQGVQLAATILAAGAMAEGRDVQLFGQLRRHDAGRQHRGHHCRGRRRGRGPAHDRRRPGPPIVMHPEHARHALARLRSDGVLLVNASVFDAEVDRPPAGSAHPGHGHGRRRRQHHRRPRW